MFRTVKSLAVIDELIQTYYIKNTHTNNYLMYDAYRDYIKNKCLFYLATASNLILLLKQEGFFRLYYYINDIEDLFFTSASELPLVMEILYRGEADKPKKIMLYWERNGFKEHLTRNNMMLKYEKLIPPDNTNPEIDITFAEKEEEFRYIKELLENSLDIYTGDRLSIEDIRLYGKNRNIICSYHEGKICGVLQFEEKNNTVWLGHIAVDPEYRGKGIAKSLVFKYIELNAITNNRLYQLWVINDNAVAVKLYENFGFVNANKSTVSMLMK